MTSSFPSYSLTTLGLKKPGQVNVALMQRIAKEAETKLGKSLPVNATGALASKLGMPWNIVRGVGVVAGAIGLVGHVREELKNPLAREIKTRTEEEATSHLH